MNLKMSCFLVAGNSVIVYLYQNFLFNISSHTRNFSGTLPDNIWTSYHQIFICNTHWFFFFDFKVVPSQQAYTETNPHQDVWKLLPSGNFPPKSRGAAFVGRRRWMFSCPRQRDIAGGICLMFVVSTTHVLSSQVTHSHVIRHTIYVL